MTEINFKSRKFTKAERSSFAYWWAHNRAFNKVAKACGYWHFRYLFHDFEKPWLKLFMDYKKVQKLHRSIARHHIEYVIAYYEHVYWNLSGDAEKYRRSHMEPDIEGMVIDWECSRFTKAAEPLNAVQEWERVRKERLPELFAGNMELADRFVECLDPIMQQTFARFGLK